MKMDEDKRVVFKTGCFPIKVKDLSEVIKDKVQLVNVTPETIITGLSFGLYYTPQNNGFLQICGADDNYVSKRMAEGGAAVLTDHIIKNLPCILVSDLTVAVFYICEWLYRVINIPTIVVTGSVGKTTTKRMINHLLKKQVRCFSVNENRNTLKDLCCFLQNIEVDDRLLVWEVSENRKNETKYTSRAIKPQIAVITNIGDSHIGTIEGGKAALLESFRSITAGMDDGGMVILNADDSDSRDLGINKETTSISIIDSSSDCFAFNITGKRNGTSFDLRFQNQITHVNLSIFGEHNVYNAMMAFVAAVLTGIDRKTAAHALKSYHNVGFRQNVLRWGGVVVYADCYNASAKSISSAIQCFCNLPQMRGKRIAVLGDIAEIDGYEEQAYKEVAEAINNSSVDIVVTYGKKSIMIHDYVTRDIELIHCATYDELNQTLEKLKSNGKNAYLIKGSRKMMMEQNLRQAFRWHYYLMRAVEKLTIKYQWRE